ncbi:hypothetical protein BDV95DRAFT_63236 [Massariosphaeria phaeospora]|uniref:Uncharacterized protein n=1 Tax=Massariosphaeria phaeospora TaxID=100035 RepID=A0A7C8MAL5_9PLEO|nr:hypothetical protein BDV95DRAFT_63236 [Massariosphaeria phaeospora]
MNFQYPRSSFKYEELRNLRARIDGLTPNFRELRKLESEVSGHEDIPHSGNSCRKPDRTTAHAKASCLVLCQQIRDHFPREIRDLIYEHLSTEDGIRVQGFYGSWRKEYPRYDPPFSLVAMPRRHFMDAAYVGPDLLKELVENWYRTSTFVISDPITSGILTLLCSDVWGLGLRPRDLLTRVVIQFSCCGTYSRPDALLRNLGLLVKFGTRTHLAIRFPRIYVPRPWCCGKYQKCGGGYAYHFGKILPVLRRLRDGGYKFCVSIQESHTLCSAYGSGLSLEAWLERLRWFDEAPDKQYAGLPAEPIPPNCVWMVES